MARTFLHAGVLGLVGGLFASGCAEPVGRPSGRAGGLDTSFLKDYAETRGFSAGQPAGASLTPDGSSVIFLRSGPRDVVRNLYEMNAASGEVHGLLRAEDILKGGQENLTPEEKARRERMRVSAKGFTWVNLSEDGTQLLAGLSGRLYVIRRSDGHVTPLPESKAGPAMDARFSPDGKFVSCIRGNDLYVIDVAAGSEKALTSGGTEDMPHGVAEFVAQEEMDRHSGYWWSSDSKSLAYQETDQREVEKLYIADARNPENPPQGWRYPRAGKTNAKVRLGIVPVAGGSTTWVEWDHEKYPYMAAVHWERDEPLTVYVQNRKQQESVLYRVDPGTGKCTELLKETDPAWVNIRADMPRWLAGQKEFLWLTERNGPWELELRSADGMPIKKITQGPRSLYGVVAIDQARREIVVAGASDPTESQLYRVGIDRGDAVALTEGRGSHGGHFSKDCNAWIETVSLMDGTVKQVLRGRDASIRAELPSVAEDPPFQANLELTTVQTAARSMHAAIIRPRNFVAGRKYPVIVSVYGGPHSNTVSASARGYLRNQWMADQGFIVVSLDGRGTMHRGRDWERAIYKDLIGPALEDQAAGLQALGAKYHELDLSRVGITGWSFGGYFSAMAVLLRPDVYHCGVAGAPVTDWLDYDTHYTERYMSLPEDNAEGYKRCAAPTYANDLHRPLLLIHGTTDDNVYFTHTIKLTEALFRAGRPYDLVILPGFTHMVPEPIVNVRLYERIVRYFKQNLVDSRPVALTRAK
ncbi:MAG TPA: DPP IV N-terminal domain-containing protein [Phycisphaerae bacterium]|nr:DPP IV N-terminal domain-containing protein [Phycisphaerae bacterium]